MGRIRVRKQAGNPYSDFIYQDQRCRALTTIKDSPVNRKNMEELLERMEAEILLGQFSYVVYFPKFDQQLWGSSHA
jgi:integrase